MQDTLSPGDDLFVWSMPVTSVDPCILARWLSLLSEEERARAKRFRSVAAYEVFIASHVLVRSLLSEVGDRRREEWCFTRGPFGKPQLSPALGSRLQFNLSHTRGLVAAAVSVEDDIGIDVEACDQKANFLSVSQRCFTPEELWILSNAAQSEKLETFYRLWTLKESYMKAIGHGLNCSLHSFSFSLDPIAITLGPDTVGIASDWQFLQLRPTPRHILAVAIHRAPNRATTIVPRCAEPGEL